MANRTFVPSPASARDVRNFVRSCLADYSSIPLDVAILLTDELAANAIVHTAQPFSVEVSVTTVDSGTDPCAEIAVDDMDFKPLPAPAEPPPDMTTGRGLQILDALSDIWGWHPTPTGKRVWFRLGRA
jgi:hypothetical protein